MLPERMHRRLQARPEGDMCSSAAIQYCTVLFRVRGRTDQVFGGTECRQQAHASFTVPTLTVLHLANGARCRCVYVCAMIAWNGCAVCMQVWVVQNVNEQPQGNNATLW